MKIVFFCSIKVDTIDEAISVVCNELRLADCKMLSRELNVSQVAIDTVVQNHPHDVESQKKSMMFLWKRNYQFKASVQVATLYHKLIELEFQGTAEKLMHYVSPSGTLYRLF